MVRFATIITALVTLGVTAGATVQSSGGEFIHTCLDPQATGGTYALSSSSLGVHVAYARPQLLPFTWLDMKRVLGWCTSRTYPTGVFALMVTWYWPSRSESAEWMRWRASAIHGLIEYGIHKKLQRRTRIQLRQWSMYPASEARGPRNINENMFSTVAGIVIFIGNFAPRAILIATIVGLSRSCYARCHSKEIMPATGATRYNKQLTRHNRLTIALSISHR